MHNCLPQFLGLPDYLVFGGGSTEPVDGAEWLGCPRWAFFVLTVLLSALMAWGLVSRWRRDQTNDRQVEAADPTI